ncbi:hypothetical protein B0H13DRAFT_2335417 [Mycena leptocephala]|nr:hypothetical protein B0H13DRAFT_2335417 [Mycena leptocephala]
MPIFFTCDSPAHREPRRGLRALAPAHMFAPHAYVLQRHTPAVAKTTANTSKPTGPSLEVPPFFTRNQVFSKCDFDTETDNESGSQCEDDNPAALTNALKDPSKAWFDKPKFMPPSLYEYFRDVIQPIISQWTGRELAQPPSFLSKKCYAPSLWIHSTESVFDLSHYRFRPAVLYRPRVFLWLPPFFVDKLCCPACGKALEKNGALSPRRVTDIEDSFYIVFWAYYCRKGELQGSQERHSVHDVGSLCQPGIVEEIFGSVGVVIKFEDEDDRPLRYRPNDTAEVERVR